MNEGYEYRERIGPDASGCTVLAHLAARYRHSSEDAWSRLRWASLYQQPQMRGYYDRLALTRQQQEDWRLARLEHLRVYGQLAPLGFGVLYLQAHHLERLSASEDSLSRRDETPVMLAETPTL